MPFELTDDLKRHIQTFCKIPGAISVAEGCAIYHTIKHHLKCDSHCAADLGSHAGKSAYFAVVALTEMKRYDVFTLVDLLYAPDSPEWEHTTQGTYSRVPWAHAKVPDFKERVLERFNWALTHLDIYAAGLSSVEFLSKVASNLPFSYMFIDTDNHQADLISREVALAKDRIVTGGLLLFHDYGNQFSAPREEALRLVDDGLYEQIEIPWDEIISKIGAEERYNDSWHKYDRIENPNFVGAFRRL